MKTKKYYAEEVLSALINGFPDIDWKLDFRDIYATMDAVVNKMAKDGFFFNWKWGVAGVSEGFITTWENLEVTDPSDKLNSYFTLPLNYADLPMERGIDEIWPMKYQIEGKNHSVVILNHRDVRLLENNMAGSMQGRLSGFPKGSIFEFTSCGVKKKYGNMGLRLAVRDSSLISADAAYPIPADKELEMIKLCVDWFREKRAIPPNKVRDKQDQA
jgi:hypothetical protein